jgi:hypothetical protein
MHFITKKFINSISVRLNNFKWTTTEKASCSCPLCGDSKKSKRKARGSFYTYKNVDLYHCYNCGDAQSFDWFLSNFDSFLYREYKLELFKDSINPSYSFYVPPKNLEEDVDENLDVFKTQKENPETEEIKSPLIFCDLKTFSELREDHPARSYASKRKLNDFFDLIYYIPNFPKWASDRFEQLEKWSKVEKHPRLLLPCYDYDNSFMGFSARAFGKEQVKYCTFRLHKDSKYFLFGMDRVDTSKKVNVVEGPIDSLMIDNAVAVMSSSLNSINIFSDYVYIFDNQPRNKEIISLIRKAIEDNKNVLIWPENFEHKDLNDAICAGITKKDLMKIIEDNTVKGLEARLKFDKWRKL